MKKFNRIRVLAPLNLLLYIAALWLVWFYPGWGGAVLAVMDGVTLAVMLLIAQRYIAVHEMSSWEQLGPKLIVPSLVLIALAIVHFVGAFTVDDTVQHAFAYVPVTLVVAVGGIYWLMTRKPPYEGI